MKLINGLLFFVFFIASTAVVLGQGPGCDEDQQPDPDRVNCPGADISIDTPEKCWALGNCTWCPTVPDTPVPWCYVSRISPVGDGYVMVGEPILSPNGATVNLRKAGRRSGVLWDDEEENLILQADFLSNDQLRIKIGPPQSTRWEVPIELNPPTGGNANPLYDIQFSNDPEFSFKVLRASTGTVLFDTSIGSKNFIYADQYLSLIWQLPSEKVYGIGENEQTSFKHDFTANKRYPLWARDFTPAGTTNIYGVQPYYTVLENDGNAHSVAVVNSNAQEFHMRAGGSISYITIGGVFDFLFFLGPTPENTVQQYTRAVGRMPMPPYWGLGFQLCRFGYDNIANMRAAVDRTEQYDIPHDVQYGDIDIMEAMMDFTYDTVRFAGLPQYIRDLKEKGIKFVTILDPFITTVRPGNYRPFDLGQQMDVWVKRADGTTATGRVWPGNMQDPVYFPDYSKPSAQEWWNILIKEFHDLLEYDGLWIDMNEPANFVDGDLNGGCPNNKWNNPPYVPPIMGDRLWAFTLCADCQHTAGRHYDTHSLYGWFMSGPTLTATQAGTGKRALVLSRSQFLGSGKWAAHWLGDNFSRWNNLHFSIIGMLQYNHFGIPLCGSDICGFNEDTTEEMCQRWHQLGAFYPFSRNHNAIGHINQDPGVWPQVANATRAALLVRYDLLPYLYTLFHTHHTRGDTVIRALWHEFPTDATAANIDTQFLWGSGLLISAVITQGATSVSAYFPDSRFYSYYDGAEVAVRGQSTVLQAPLNFIPVHVHGGNILPTQNPARNTEISRNNPFGLIVAVDDDGMAEGSLFYDDGGDTIDSHAEENYFLADYHYQNKTLTVDVTHNGYAAMGTKIMDTVRVFGEDTITIVLVNEREWVDWTQHATTKEIRVQNLRLPANEPMVVSFV